MRTGAPWRENSIGCINVDEQLNLYGNIDMMKVLAVVVAAAALAAIAAAAVVHQAGPSTVELDADIASLKTDILGAQADAARYSGGLILVQTQLRAAILKNTLAMLEQKRESFLRGISLSYQESTKRISAPADDAAAASELAKARAEEQAAREEAAMYSGGLLQTMALVREATAKTTEAAVQQRVALAKLGIPLAYPSVASPPVQKSPGKTASDKDAL